MEKVIIRLYYFIRILSFQLISSIRVYNESPIIVLDAMGVLALMAENQHEIFCGGRHQNYHTLFDRSFGDLVSFGAKLVFFSDLNVQSDKSAQWMARRDQEYDRYTSLFDSINNGLSVQQFLQMDQEKKAMSIAEHAMFMAGKKYDEYHFATKHDCDAELAKYARDHRAMAVLAEDSDYLVFEGFWEYWSIRQIDLKTMTTVEYNRKILCQHFSLTYKQMPLLATVMSNDDTTFFYAKLRQFHDSLGSTFHRWLNVAKFVREKCESALQLTEADIAAISKSVFGTNDSAETRLAIRNGIESYDLNFTVHRETNALLEKASSIPTLYKMLTSPILTVPLPMYDMRKHQSMPEIVSALVKRMLGVLFKHQNTKHKFELFTKWSHEEKYSSKTMQPEFPPKKREYTYVYDIHLQPIRCRRFSFLSQ